MNIKDKPIGFFDSGVGGLSVLKEAVKVLPNEDFIYFGDSKNAPYGVKNVDEIKKLTFDAVEFLVRHNVKAIVIACNTATSAAIIDLRKTYINIPIIGIEPALKPAVELNKEGKIIIMATPTTLCEKKFFKLMNKYKSISDIIPLPCPGLVEFIEEGTLEGEEIDGFLEKRFFSLKDEKIASIVLGCTHYPFVKKELSKILGQDISIIDGSRGTAVQLKRKLISNKFISSKTKKGEIKIFNSLKDNNIIDLSFRLLNS
ncbi:glutamate racemase [Clostridium aestuarii]|uniref:Glutamate racemase n=1 Tax=Clostridium aestuarii TaxID=338193 RepID=A0ABT4D2U2_9CLOT|nr:glutamate racemase [Clostridium aestuarii]MCY6484972.1 glutamate racemase [Clostridium aestuarii]